MIESYEQFVLESLKKFPASARPAAISHGDFALRPAVPQSRESNARTIRADSPASLNHSNETTEGHSI
jgi:hypothetical protein